MRELKVSLDVVSDVLTLSELASTLQREPGPGSHSRGDQRMGQLGEFGETRWSLYSQAPSEAPLEEHLKSIQSQFPSEKLSSLPVARKAGITGVFIDVAVFFEVDTFPSVELPREDLQLVQDYGASLVIRCYPWNDAAEAREGA